MDIEKRVFNSNEELYAEAVHQMHRQKDALLPDSITVLIAYEIGKVELETETVEVTAVATDKFSNAYGIIHGGYISWVMDIGAATWVRTIFKCNTSLTAGMDISFLRPTRVGDVLCVNSELLSVEGRKIKIKSTITADGEVKAEAIMRFVGK